MPVRFHYVQDIERDRYYDKTEQLITEAEACCPSIVPKEAQPDAGNRITFL